MFNPLLLLKQNDSINLNPINKDAVRKNYLQSKMQFQQQVAEKKKVTKRESMAYDEAELARY